MGNVKTKENESDFVIHLMIFRLREASLSLLELYGSQYIKSVKFRDSFVMIGQKGLARGRAIEMVIVFNCISMNRMKSSILASTKT